MVIIGLGVRLYFDSKNKTPQTWLMQQLRPVSDQAEDLGDVPPEKLHKLKVEIVEVDAATSTSTSSQQRVALVNVPYFGYLEVRTTGVFRKQNEPYDLKGNFVDGPICHWKVEKLERFQNGAWQKVSLPQDLSTHRQIYPQQTDWSAISSASLGKWRVKVALNVECFNDVGDVWQGSARRDIEFEVTPKTLSDVSDLQWRQATGAKGRKIVLKPQTPYISHLEWSPQVPTQNGEKPRAIWQPIPQAGEAGFPLTFPDSQLILVRAVRLKSQNAWPNHPQILPVWRESDQSSTNDDVPSHNGEEFPVFLSMTRSENANSAATPQEIKVSAECGNTVRTTFRIVENLATSAPKMIFLYTNQSQYSKLPQEMVIGSKAQEIYVGVRDGAENTGGISKRYRVRLRALYADGSKAGHFEKNEYFIGNSGNWGENTIEYSPATKVGKATIVAEALDANGKVARKSAAFAVSLVEPKLVVNSTRGWNWDGEVWKREMQIVAEDSRGSSVDGIPVQVSIQTPTRYNVDKSASWLSATRGTTRNPQGFVVTQFWKFVPGASLNPDNYQVAARVATPTTTSKTPTSSTRSAAKKPS